MGGGTVTSTEGADDWVVVQHDHAAEMPVPNAHERQQQAIETMLAALRDRVGDLQGAVDSLVQIIRDGGAAGIAQAGKVLQDLGFLHPRADGAPAQVKVWYKAPAAVVAGIAVVSVATWKILEGIGAAIWSSPKDPSPITVQVDPLNVKSSVEEEKIPETPQIVDRVAAEIITAPQTPEDHIAARRGKRQKDN